MQRRSTENQVCQGAEKYDRTLAPPFAIGSWRPRDVQVGRHPNKWDKSGVVVETKDNYHYVVKVAVFYIK